MKVTVYNSKGGAGKTPISTNIVLEKEWAIGTNELHHLFETFIPDNQLLAVPMEEEFPEIPDEIDIVFDLAGSMSAHSKSITSAIQQSDLVLVPIYNELKSLNAGASTILEVAELNKNIMVVATKLEKKRGEVFKDWTKSQDFMNVEQWVNKAAPDMQIPIFPLKASTAFDRIFEDEKSINQMMQEDALLARAFKDAATQFDAIFDYIDEQRHA